MQSAPGTKIEATFFDVVTQPWFFTYFDYIMIAKDGNFSEVDRWELYAKTDTRR